MPLPERNIIKEIKDSDDVLNFMNVAKQYCTFIENYQSKDVKEFLLVMHNNLLVLYQAGNKLPHIDFQEEADFKEEIDNGFLERVIIFIADRLADSRYYLHLFNPADNSDNEVIYGDLLDDLGDIYKDLKRSLLILDIGTDVAKENAIWQFKFDLDNHWGDHCINAIYASHYFLKEVNK